MQVLSEGIPGWEKRGYAVSAEAGFQKSVDMPKLSPAELKKMMETEKGAFILLDVRELDEFKAGYIPGAINIPLSNFDTADALDKGKKLVIYCASGARHYNAYRKLKKMSFTNISQATFFEWRDAGMPVEVPKAEH